MERTIISWNFPNWFTIFLMAAGSYALFGVAAQFLKANNVTLPGLPGATTGGY